MDDDHDELWSVLGGDFDVNEGRTRASAREQPPARFSQSSTKGNTVVRWYCVANVARQLTGKANGWIKERGGPFAGISEEAVLAERGRFISRYMKPRAPSKPRECERPPPRESRKRGARPESLEEPQIIAKRLQDWRRRPGPGRGRRFEAAAPYHAPLSILEEDNHLPLAAMTQGNWFEQLQLKTMWQNKTMRDQQGKIRELEVLLTMKSSRLEHQEDTIKKLRERVCNAQHQTETP